MEEKDLDHILLEQLNSAKNTKKTIKRIKGFFPHDDGLHMVEIQNNLRIKFFESMIQDKSIINKKIIKKKPKENDILYKNPLIEVYKYTMFISVYGYVVLSEYVKSYTSYFKKDSNEKNTKD